MADRTIEVDSTTVPADAAPDGDDARLLLDQARSRLLVRLHRRSDDFAATIELQAVNARAAELASHADRLESDRLAHGGLSGIDVMRQWLRSKVGRRNGPRHD